jgi:hypothetical protein
MGYIEEMGYWDDYHQAQGAMKKKWYVWEMNKHKPRIHPETKTRQQIEFEDSVIAFAQVIQEGREVADDSV